MSTSTTTEMPVDAPEKRPGPGRRPRPDRLAGVRAWWDGLPMRARLVGILVTLLVAALTATGLGTQYVLQRYLLSQVDSQLRSGVQSFIDYPSRALAGPQSQRGPLSYGAQKWSYDDGSVPFVDNPPGRSAPSLPDMTQTQAQARRGRPFTVGSTSGDARWRVMAIPIPFPTTGVPKLTFNDDITVKGSVQIALPLEQVDSAVFWLRLLVICFGLAVTLLCALLGWLAIRRSFVPLTEVEETAAAIAAGDLSRRIPEHPASTEVGRLTSSLNGMLGQIETAFRSREASEQRTRRFAADASHELRTPLASIRGFAELYRQGAVREPDDVARTMGRIEDESRRMGSLVEDLLLLARLDEQRPSRTDPVDLAVLAGDATHDARGLAPDRTVRLVGLTDDRGPEPAVVTGDDNRLRQVVANLIGNAVRHTPAGSPIEVAVGTEAGRAVLEVRDHGPGLAPEHSAKVFERFYRVDASRARTQGGGSGLGLSIVTAVLTAHGGRVGVAPTPGGGATFRVELPLTTVEVSPDVTDLDAEESE